MIFCWLSRDALERLYRDCTDDGVRNELYVALRSADLFGELEAKVALVANTGHAHGVLAVTFCEAAAADRAWEKLRSCEGDEVLRAVVECR